MLTTARDLIGRALSHLGVLAAAETLQAEEAADGFIALNALVDELSHDSALLTCAASDMVVLTTNIAQLTMGAGGTVNADPALLLLTAQIREGERDSPLRLCSKTQYDAVPNKSMVGKPTMLLYQDSYPLAKITLWPVPDKAYTLIINSQKKLTSFTNLSDQILLPDGFADMLCSNLAIRLAPQYGHSASPELVVAARDGMARLKRRFKETPVLGIDGALQVSKNYNIYSDL